jgi:hypothetical protein
MRTNLETFWVRRFQIGGFQSSRGDGGLVKWMARIVEAGIGVRRSCGASSGNHWHVMSSPGSACAAKSAAMNCLSASKRGALRRHSHHSRRAGVARQRSISEPNRQPAVRPCAHRVSVAAVRLILWICGNPGASHGCPARSGSRPGGKRAKTVRSSSWLSRSAATQPLFCALCALCGYLQCPRKSVAKRNKLTSRRKNAETSPFGRKSQKVPCFCEGGRFQQTSPFDDFSRVARPPSQKHGENDQFRPAAARETGGVGRREGRGGEQVAATGIAPGSRSVTPMP